MDNNQSQRIRGVTNMIIMFLMFLGKVLGDTDQLPTFQVEEFEVDCPDDKTPALPYIHVPWNTPFRAYKTLPNGIRISQSAIPKAGLGAFSDTFIRKDTVLAEFEGEVVIKLIQISDYAWKVKRNGRKLFYVDAHDVATSNWLRWINCSRNSREENVDVLHCKGKVYYVARRDIHPAEELLVYYGDGYAKDLLIDIHNYDNTGHSDSNIKNCTTNCSHTEL